jgi:hypothetical protein
MLYDLCELFRLALETFQALAVAGHLLLNKRNARLKEEYDVMN